MNSLELTMSAIKGVPERVPFNPFVMHLAASLAKVDYSREYCQKPDVLVDSMIKCAEFFGIDHVHVSTDAYIEANAWGVEVDFDIHTPVAKSYLNIDEFDSIERPDILENERILNRVKAVNMLKKKTEGTQCVMGWIEAPINGINSLFGMLEVMLLYGEPDWRKKIKNLVDRTLPVYKEFAKLQIEAGADIIGCGDSAASQIGPMRYEMCFLESTRSLINYIQKDVPVLYHTCGNNSIIDKEGRDMIKLISSTNAAIIDFDYQVDLKIAKTKVGKNNSLRGNTNTTILGDPSYTSVDVVNEISKTIEFGKPGGMYMYAAGCEWPWEPLDLAIRNLSIAKALIEKTGRYSSKS